MLNKEIKEELSKYKIPYEEGVLCLLALYYGLDKPLPSIIPEILFKKVLATGIVIYDKGSLTWKVPLFETQEINFAWVADFRTIFKKLNPDRAGSLNTCLSRMKKFFSENPSVRSSDVMGALSLYLKSVKDPQYLITSHKFIYDGAGASRNSHLEEWLEKYYEIRGAVGRTSQSITMK